MDVCNSAVDTTVQWTYIHCHAYTPTFHCHAYTPHTCIFYTLPQGFGLAGTYALFAAIGVLAVASIAATVPETKGKTLEEIQAMWENRGG